MSAAPDEIRAIVREELDAAVARAASEFLSIITEATADLMPNLFNFFPVGDKKKPDDPEPPAERHLRGV